MAQRIGELSTEEFEALVERAVDRRLRVWLTQVMDALGGPADEAEAELRADFAASLRRSREQAQRGETTDLETFRAMIQQ
jgi:hypothetical protein